MKHVPFSFSRSFRFWIPLFWLGALFFYGLVSLPPAGEANPTFHVASRYVDRGAGETGFTSAFLGVLLDYRSFDLMLLGLFFLSLGLTVLLFCVVENLPRSVFKSLWAFLSVFSFLILLVLGWLGLKSGSNFMDYEFWSGIWGPAARIHGAWITGGLVFLTVLASLIWTGKVLVQGRKKTLDHQ